jgi:hypothetical protein
METIGFYKAAKTHRRSDADGAVEAFGAWIST